ncbi:hypothetical protein THMIRHAS_14580 [Thiosulfatimonas sediminis]|uniref:NERD domain-containing protein n=1 Tax=Thiosulfatimonas sediminis TaxID=2675054 RepID=A0A6F8PVD6_9GAMM|nr:nuclease-related domain-containing protein [Thiosulfatimonas sediminis]BBP46085.1 hypothetical protein THMIRHAS_14580 [Thiosulfatimonas sediminis]
MFSRDKLKQWRELIRVKPQFENPEVLAGRQAEDFLAQIVESNLKHKGAYCFVGKRVPNNEKACRSEIDLIVLTKKQLHVIEVKNWSGLLSSHNGDWIQHKSDGQQLRFDNLTAHNSSKLRALVDYLHSYGAAIEPRFISQKVVFINPRLQIAPQIAQDPNVIPRSRLDKYLKSQKGASFSERMLHSVIESCTSSEAGSIILDGLFKAMQRKQLKLAVQALGELRSWDLIGLHGGKILQGDARKLYIGSHIIDPEPLERESFITLKWRRQKVSALLKSYLLNMALGKTKIGKQRYVLNPIEDNLKFHKAGQAEISRIPLKEIEWIKRG